VADLAFVSLGLVCFAVLLFYVKACERLLASSDDDSDDGETP
jgi:hypothetical protein